MGHGREGATGERGQTAVATAERPSTDHGHHADHGLITQRPPPPGHVRRAFGSKAHFCPWVINPARCSESERAIPPGFGSRPVNPARGAIGAVRPHPPTPLAHPRHGRPLTTSLERETPQGLWPRGVDLLRLSAGLVVQSERCSASRAERRAFGPVRGQHLGHRRRPQGPGRTCQLALLSGAERGLMAIDRPRRSRPRTSRRRRP